MFVLILDLVEDFHTVEERRLHRIFCGLLEGVFHAVLMAVVLVPVTVLFAWFVMPSVVEAMGSWCAVYTFSLLPLWLVLPVILLLAILVPLACLRFITRGSITQRMRRVE